MFLEILKKISDNYIKFCFHQSNYFLSLIILYLKICNIFIRQNSSFKSEILRMLERIQVNNIGGTSCVVHITSRNIIKLSMKRVNSYIEQ